METNNLPGSVKVAVLLKYVEKGIQDRILSMLSQEEKEAIVNNLPELDDVSPDLIEKISKEFTQMFSKNKSKYRTKNFDQGNLKLRKKSGKLETIQSIEPEKLFKFIKDEHPQTIAVILAHLLPKTASNILAMLSEETRSDVALRIVNLDKVMAGMIDEIDDVFEDIITNINRDETYKAGGIENLADILNQASEDTVEVILNTIESVDEELVIKIKQRMFVFDDMVFVDDRGMQKVLRKIDTNLLAVALKAASDEVKEKVFKNMSERAGKILTEEIETLRAIKIKEVEEAQQKIADIVQKMESNGDLAIIRDGGGDYIN